MSGFDGDLVVVKVVVVVVVMYSRIGKLYSRIAIFLRRFLDSTQQIRPEDHAAG